MGALCSCFFQQSPHNVPNSHETSNVGNALNSQAINDFFGVPFPRWLNHLVAHEPTCIFSTHPNFCLGPLFFQKLAQQAAHGCKTGVFGTALGRSAPKSEIKVMVKPPGGPHEKRLPPRPLKRPAMLVRICRACKKMHLGVQFLSGLFGPRRANWRAGINHLMAHPNGNPTLAKPGQSPGRQYFFCSVHRLRQPLPGGTDSGLCHFFAQLLARFFLGAKNAMVKPPRGPREAWVSPGWPTGPAIFLFGVAPIT